MGILPNPRRLRTEVAQRRSGSESANQRKRSVRGPVEGGASGSAHDLGPKIVGGAGGKNLLLPRKKIPKKKKMLLQRRKMKPQRRMRQQKLPKLKKRHQRRNLLKMNQRR